jgi:hypothetical protein
MSIPDLFATEIATDSDWRIPKLNKILSARIKAVKKRQR